MNENAGARTLSGRDIFGAIYAMLQECGDDYGDTGAPAAEELLQITTGLMLHWRTFRRGRTSIFTRVSAR